MSDEQKNIDDGKRWQVDYDYNLVWEQTNKSKTDLQELEELFSHAEDVYDIVPLSFEKTEGPYYKITLKPKEEWKSTPDIDEDLKKNFCENVQEINVAFLTISNDTRENNKKGKDKIISSNLKKHINSIKLRCQGKLYYENLKNKIIIARYSYMKNEDINKSLYIAFPENVIGNGQKSYRVKCQNLQKARKYGIYADRNSEYKEVVFTADNMGIYLANREVLHGICGNNEKIKEIDFNENKNEKQNLEFPYNRIVFGAPGTGKSHALKVDSKVFEDNVERVTFHPNYSYSQFVGTYKPIQGEKTSDIIYEYVPGPFMRVYVRALNHPKENFLLLIEEINRANVAAVFGDVFQLLDRKNGISEYPVATTEDIKKYLKKTLKCLMINDGDGNSRPKELDEYSDSDMKNYRYLSIPDNMYIWATMNSADQGVFPMDTAFKRRWEFEYLSVDDDEQVAAIKDCKIPMCFSDNKASYYVDWNGLRTEINNILTDECKVNEDKLLGPFFISKNILDEIKINKDKIDELEIIDEASLTEDDKDLLKELHQKEKSFIKAFESKVIMYLFEDVMKMRPEKIFAGHHKNKGKMIFSEICRAFEKDGEKIFGIEELEHI